MKAIRIQSTSIMLGCVIAVFVVLVSRSVARADAPALIPVQGLLTDVDGVPIDGEHRLDFILYDDAAGHTSLYSTAYSDVSIDNGNFVVYLGDQEGEALDLEMFRDRDDVWLEIVIDGSQIITPRIRLATTAYAGFAQYCGDADTLQGNTAAAFVTTSGDSTIDGDLTVDGDLNSTTSTIDDLTITGTLTPGALTVQEFHVATTPGTTLKDDNTMDDFPELSATFTVAQPTPLMVTYLISMGGSNSHLVTHLVIDDDPVVKTIVGNTAYWGNTSSYVGTVSAGTHTVKVLYRTPIGGTCSDGDYTDCRMDVLVLGR
jgi:hypothetical protein